MRRLVVQSFLLLDTREKSLYSLLVLGRIFIHALDLLGLAAVGLLGTLLARRLNGNQTSIFLGLNLPETPESFMWVTLAIAGFFSAKSVAGAVFLRQTSSFLARVEARSSQKVAQYVFMGDLSRVRELSQAETQWALGTSSHVAFSKVLYSGAALVSESALFLSVFVAFLLVDVVTALGVSLYFLTILMIFQIAISQRLRRLGERTRENSIRMNSSIIDLLRAFKEATVLGLRPFFLAQFGTARRQLALDQGLERFVNGVPRYFVEAGLISGVALLLVSQILTENTSEALVTTGVVLAGGTRMMAAILPIQNAVTELRILGGQAKKAQVLLGRAFADDIPGEKPSWGVQPLTEAREGGGGFSVRLNRVSFAYPEDSRDVIQRLSMEISGGSFVALIGPSGGGKTTLADLMLGLHRPRDGRVTIEGIRPEEVTLRYPGSLSYVPQQPGLVAGTVAQNVALGRDPDRMDRARIWEALSEAELKHTIESLEGGLDAPMGAQSNALSGGQIQRIGLARALYNRPRLIVLDEATSALDAETETAIIASLQKLRGEVTLVVIAHRLSTVKQADTVFVVEDGCVTASGRLSEVREKAPLVERYIQLMSMPGSNAQANN